LQKGKLVANFQREKESASYRKDFPTVQLSFVETHHQNRKGMSNMKKYILPVILVISLLTSTVAFAAGLLSLPATPVTITHGPWFGNAPASPIAITLSDVPGGYDVTNGTYNGWCIEDNGQDNAPQLSGTLSEPTGDPWDKINWVLNNWKNYSTNYYDAQVAIWMLTGTNQSFVTAEAQAIYDAAILNGAGFVPGAGQLVAVITFADNAAAGQFQDTIIEVPLPPDDGGSEGCTPGYWKQPQHFDSWVGYTQGQTLESVFDVPDSYGMDNNTLLEALSFKGGSGTVGAAEILLRASVAALLNSSSVNYPLATADLINQVNAALASGNRGTMLNLATQLDLYNNLGCPLN
jgi:hypothetical protein